MRHNKGYCMFLEVNTRETEGGGSMSESEKALTGDEVPSKNFIIEAVEEDLHWGQADQRSVHTRFPPEPNGYLHIGHAKAICINFPIAEKYNGECNLRMDDTNPAKEDMEYVQAIQKDIEWLGFRWDRLLFASDYYEKLYEFAHILIDKGLAYVDEQSGELIREQRGTLTQPGTESPHRNRSVEESKRLFIDMREGKFPDGGAVLRAKIDMASPNINMRDPIMYRVLRATHYRTGDAWCIYPMYDFAHPLSDAIEGITHSLCSLEFEDHRPLYDWFVRSVGLWNDAPPRQIEFARLNLTQTIMSKRYLKKLVDEKLVDGWDDPRMPTLSGIRRRGYTPEAIRNFCNLIGVSKAYSMVDSAMLEYCVREDLGTKAPRMMAVVDPLKLTIENWPEGTTEEIEVENMPGNPEMGSRIVHFGRTAYIEREDFMEDPPKKYFRLRPEGEVRLRGGYIVKCERIVKDDDGRVTEVICSYDPDSKSGENARKVKGTLHWVNADEAVSAQMRLYDYLLLPEDEESAEKDFSERMNPASIIVQEGFVEPALAQANAGDTFQFMRVGYFCLDRDSETLGRPIFNRVVGLKDSWSKQAKK